MENLRDSFAMACGYLVDFTEVVEFRFGGTCIVRRAVDKGIAHTTWFGWGRTIESKPFYVAVDGI
jgi:hypothetical protein